MPLVNQAKQRTALSPPGHPLPSAGRQSPAKCSYRSSCFILTTTQQAGAIVLRIFTEAAAGLKEGKRLVQGHTAEAHRR